jgi:hypothetical protein
MYFDQFVIENPGLNIDNQRWKEYIGFNFMPYGVSAWVG